MNAEAEEARHYRRRAAKLQMMAAGMSDAKVAQELLEQAADYEDMARGFENLRRAFRRA